MQLFEWNKSRALKCVLKTTQLPSANIPQPIGVKVITQNRIIIYPVRLNENKSEF